jgi:fibronectin type 3 domain-containing protein
VTNGTVYGYCVAGVSSAGEGYYSQYNAAYATPGGTLPIAPTGLIAAPSSNQINLSWDPVNGAYEYNVYRCAISGSEGLIPIVTNIYGSSGTSSYTDNSTSPNTTYYYQVTAITNVGEGPKSNEAVGTTGGTQLPAPTAITAVPGASQVTVNWSPVSGATSYILFREAGGSYWSIYQTGLTATSYVDTGVSSGTNYGYYVAGMNLSGEGYTNQYGAAYATPGGTVASAPTGLIASPSYNNISLSWNAVSGASEYNIYRSNTAGGEGGVPVVSNVYGNYGSGSYTDYSVTSGATYYYQVTAVTNVGESGKSNEAVATCGATPLPAPAAITANPGNSQVTVAWSAVTGATSYNLFRNSNSGSFALYQMGLTANSYVDTGLTNGTNYGYYCAAVNNTGEGSASSYNAAYATPGGAVSAAPTGLIASPSNGQIQLSWNLVSGVSQYNVYRSTTSFGEGTVPIAMNVYGSYGSGSYYDSTASTNTTYFYQVTAVTNVGESAKSNQAVATCGATPLPAPTVITADPGNSQISVQWATVTGATSYNLFREVGGSSWSLYQLGLTANSYVDTGLTNGTNYGYYCAAVNNTGEGSASSYNAAYATPTTTALTTPTGLTATAYSSYIGLSWSSVSGIYEYNVYRGTAAAGEGAVPIAENVYGYGGSVTYQDYSAVSGTTYYYVVTAVSSAGESGKSNESSATIGAATPAAPSSITATGGSTQITVSWSAVTGATSYDLFRQVGSGSFSLYQSGLSTTTYADTSVTAGITYSYYVTAVNGAGQGSASADASASLAAPPAPPTNLTATAGSSQVTLTWNSSAGASSYSVYRGTATGGESATAIATGVTATPYVDGTVVNGTTYYYVVTALNNVGPSSKSNEASATPQLAAPGTPSGLTAMGGANQVALSWSSSSGATTYNIYRSVASGAEGSTPLVSGVTSTAYTDTTVTNGTTYYYEVTAVNASGQSAKSSEASATPEPATPKAYHATQSSQYGSTQAALSGGWVSDNALLTGTSSFSSGYAGEALVDLGASGLTATQVQVTAGSDGLGYDPYGLYGSNDGVTWTAVTIPTGWTAGAYTATISQVYRYYQLTFSDANGPGSTTLPQFNIVTGAPPTSPSAPTNLAATAGNSQVSLTWTASSGATSYSVYRGTAAGGESTTALATGVTSAAYTDATAVNGTTYYYVITATNTGGTSGKSNEASATPEPPAPAAPTNLTATGGNSQVSLTWTASSGATSYSVYRGTAAGGESTTALAAGLTSAAYTDATAVKGTTYYYEVSANNAGGASGKSNEASATPALAAPSAPTNLAATASNSQVSLTWTLSAGATAYSIYRGTTAGGESSTALASGVTSTSYTDTTAANGTTYYYKVTATNGGGASGYSNEASAAPALVAPAAPGGLSASPSNAQVSLSWSPSAWAASYNVYRGTASGAESSTAIASGILTSTYTDTTTTNGTDYYYVVAAVNTAGASGYSNEASATPSASLPASPTGLSGSPGDGQVSLTWTAVAGAASYNVYQSTAGGALSLYQPGLTDPSFTDFGLTDGTAYTYAVTAVNGNGESGYSNEVVATPQPAVPAAPQYLSAAPGNGQISLYWAPDYEAASYSIYRGTSAGGESTSPIATGITGDYYADNTVVNDTTYYYVVTATNVSGTSGDSNETSAVPDASFLSAPANLTVTPGDTVNSLAWNAVAGAVSYNIYQYTDDEYEVDGPYATSSTASFVDTGLTDGTTYYYIVTAVDGSTEGAGSNEAQGTPEPAPPSAPTGLAAVVGNTQLSLTWNPVTGANTYNLYRSTSSGGEGTVPYVTGLSDPSFIDTGLANGTTYYYTATAVGDVGEGAKSLELASTPESSVLWAPQYLLATPSPSAITLYWDPAPGATTYNIYRSTTAGGEGATPYQTAVTDSTFTDTSVVNGTTYYYTVSAVAGSVISATSNEASATPAPAPLAPTSLSATGGILQVALGWAATSSGADSYNIYRGTASGQEDSVPIATGITALTYLDNDPSLTPGNLYYYEVTAVQNVIEGPPSNEASATPTNPVPAAPVIGAVASASGQITLGWSAVPYASSYNLYCGTATGAESTPPVVSGLTSTSYTDSNVVNGAPYYYTLIAVGPGGASPASAEVSATPYAAPTGLTIVPGDVEALLTWTSVIGASTNGGGYLVYRATSPAGPFVQINGTPISAGAAYLDTDNGSGLVTGTTYYYTVAYVDGNGNVSPQSEQVSVTTVTSNGVWTFSVDPGGSASSPSSSGSSYGSGLLNNMTATISVLSAGPTTADTPESATASILGTWTASWTPNTAGAYPGLYVIDEVQGQSLNDQVSGQGSGDASVSIVSGPSLATVQPSAAMALAGLPVVTSSIDTSTPGVVNFEYTDNIHSLTLTQTGTATTGYSETESNTIRFLHVFTPAYFASHFAAGAQISLTYNVPSATISASSDAPPGTASGVQWSAGGLCCDVFSSYAPAGN